MLGPDGVPWGTRTQDGARVICAYPGSDAIRVTPLTALHGFSHDPIPVDGGVLLGVGDGGLETCWQLLGADGSWNTTPQERVSAGEMTWLRMHDRRHFVFRDEVSDDLTGTLHVVDVRAVDGVLYFDAVDAENVGATYRVDYVDDAFVYTEEASFTGEVVATIPLGWPAP